MYIAFINIEDIYKLFNKYNIEYGKYNIKLIEPINKEYNILNDIPIDNCNNDYSFISSDIKSSDIKYNFNNLYIEYNTKYISYSSLIEILKLIKSISIKTKNIKNIENLDFVINYLSKTFSNIATHLNTSQSLVN